MKKVIVISVIALFIGVGITSSTGVNVGQTSYLLNAGELAWWKSDECDGTTLWDCSSHNYHGTIYGADWTPGCCLDFDGIDDYVDFDNHSLALGINKTDDYFVYVRFKSIAAGMIYSMSHTNPDGPYFNLELDSDGKITISIGSSFGLLNLSTSGSYNDGDWHLVEMEFFGSLANPTLDMYVDGELDGSITDWLPPMLNEDFITAKVGRDSNAESDYFDGEIDDIKIYKSPYWWGPYPPVINGPNSGKPGESLTFIFNAIHPGGYDVRFHIDWGDGNTDTTTYVPEGTDKSVSHIWDVVDTYTITAYAEDEYGERSPPTTFTVIIPRNKMVNRPRLQFFQSHPNLFPMLERLLNLLK